MKTTKKTASPKSSRRRGAARPAAGKGRKIFSFDNGAVRFDYPSFEHLDDTARRALEARMNEAANEFHINTRDGSADLTRFVSDFESLPEDFREEFLRSTGWLPPDDIKRDRDARESVARDIAMRDAPRGWSVRRKSRAA